MTKLGSLVGVALVAVGFGGITPARAAIVAPGHLDVVEIEEDPNGVSVELEGTIAAPLADEYAEAFAKIEPSKTLYLKFNSPGGSVNEGLRIIDLIQAQKKNGRHIISIVLNGEVCASMCVPLFLQGDERRAGAVAAFMFHGPYPGEYTNVPDPVMAKNLLKIFTEHGVSEAWLDKLAAQNVFSKPGEYWMSAQELYDGGTGVITHVINRHRTYAVWVAPFDPQLRPR